MKAIATLFTGIAACIAMVCMVLVGLVLQALPFAFALVIAVCLLCGCS